MSRLKIDGFLTRRICLFLMKFRVIPLHLVKVYLKGFCSDDRRVVFLQFLRLCKLVITDIWNHTSFSLVQSEVSKSSFFFSFLSIDLPYWFKWRIHRLWRIRCWTARAIRWPSGKRFFIIFKFVYCPVDVFLVSSCNHCSVLIFFFRS